VLARLEGQTHEVSAGQACLQKPQRRRELRAQTAAGWESIGVRLRPHALHGSLPAALVWSPSGAEQNLLDATFPLLRQWQTAGTPAARRSAAAAVQTLLTLCAGQVPSPAALTEQPPWLQLALERLEQAPRRDLAELSREAGYSPAQFRVLFQEHTGYPPRDYAAACLDRQARRLLMETDGSIDSIAAALGFSATAHFIRFFKRQNATTPAQFRRSGGV
jgi:AraC-like DNA-binding protein